MSESTQLLLPLPCDLWNINTTVAYMLAIMLILTEPDF